jgi:hypothetical protein
LGLAHVDKKTEEDYADEEIEECSLFSNIPLNVWRVILKKAKSDPGYIGKILVDICPQGEIAFYDFIIGLWEETSDSKIIYT